MVDTISKAQLARVFRVSKTSVTKWCKRGLPVRTDGFLNRAQAIEWVNANRLIFRGAVIARPRRVVEMPTPEQWAAMEEAAAAFLDGGWTPENLTEASYRLCLETLHVPGV